MRTLRDLGEAGLIERLRRQMPRASSVLIGIGDDAAVLRVRPDSAKRRWLFASDMIVEGVHFRRRDVPARWIGWKALASNVSDIAAMGGVPHWAVVSIGLPSQTPVRFVDELYVGLRRCARRFDLAIVGGDTVRASQVVVDVAILGSVERRRLVVRSGARVGDVLFVTGRLGGSLRRGRHAALTPRVREARALGGRLRLHAMMDLSDGLASDLWQLSRASRVTMRIEAQDIPIARSARTLHHALMDGEDFELLFAVSRRDAARVPHRVGTCPVTRIGEAVGRGVGVFIRHPSGRSTPLKPTGFQHFRSLDSHHGLWPWARSGFHPIPRPAASGSLSRNPERSRGTGTPEGSTPPGRGGAP